MTKELQALSALVKMYLEEMAPILSGNLYREIVIAELVNVSDHEITFCINAPFYDTKEWRKKGVIIHTNKVYKKEYGNITDYAMWLNDVGAFGTHNQSMHWVNRALNEAASLIPNAEIINKLEL